MINNIAEKNLKCLILFGSHARGDHSLHSDIDLLGIETSQDYTVRNVNTVNFSFYSPERALLMSNQGDLFYLHIISEGKCLFNEDFFTDLKNNFRYKDNYLSESSTAYYLALKIYEQRDNVKNWEIANKRISWCVRTILIAIGAERRIPAFSKTSLALILSEHEYRFSDALFLIDAKNNKVRNDLVINNLFLFLQRFSYLNKFINKKMFYSNGIIHSTIDAIINSTPVNYD